MSTFNSAQTFLLIGGRNVLGSRRSMEFEALSPAKDRTPLGVTAVQKEHPGVSAGAFAHAGWFDEAIGGVNDAIMGATGRTGQVICAGFCDNVLGAEVICLAGALVGSYKRGIQAEEFHKADAVMEVTGPVDDNAVIIAPLAARTTAGNTQSTPVDNAASSANGARGYLQVTALTLGGYTNCVVKQRHSADNVTYADLGTFAVVTAIGAERITIAGTVNRYVAISWAWTGSGSGQSITALVGLQRL